MHLPPLVPTLALAGLIAISPAKADDATSPLAGTAWTGAGERASFADIEAAARTADFVLVGEIHTNPEHHANQARLIAAMARAGRKPVVVLEMVPKSLQGALDAFLAEESPDAAELGERLDWEKRGWPDWTIYRPVAEAALAAGLALAAGDLDRETIRAIGRGEAEPEESVAYPDDTREKLGEEIRQAHCNLMPEEAIPAMVTVQQARDLSMADAMLAAGDDGAVLIAGGGHTRKDWGVPFVLRAKAPDRTVLSIGQIEVAEGMTSFADHLGEGETSLPHDYVVFTERSDDTDHCAELEERMGKGQ
ncbi:ChaN family lipoprotein [Oricola thermophila]|uniref:ChaN family lipoprotein n=1 Tax=Oricola thermophila TaxID=2742145 RepID=A0A6N1VL75_9HYPH|nr:ChaN family lipoprotein [Oricola thermophila]QKV19707.1 ChaN family lipoprotein [Oricola thermophila]